MIRMLLITLLAGLGLWWVYVAWLQTRDRRQRRQVWQALDAARDPNPPRFEFSMVDGLPEVAQRYLLHAIEPGTPLQRLVHLEMQGLFVLNGKALPMFARQVLAPATLGTVWHADIGRGLMRLCGSDGYHRPERGESVSWTKFWLLGLLPLARMEASTDHRKAAATRVMLESLWSPAALLPLFGAHWTQTGTDTAQIRFDGMADIEPMHIRLNPDGSLADVQALRWSDANADKAWRLQPFGGRMLETGRFGGFRIPVRVELGYHFGTPDYAPFFMATVTSARY